MRCLLAIVAALFAFTIPVSALTVDYNCRATQIAGAAVQGRVDVFSFTGETWVDIPGMIVTIDNKGSIADCAVVNFEAVTNTPEGGTVFLRALRDSVIAARPRGVRLENRDDLRPETAGAVFVFDNLPQGVHEIKLQVRMNSAEKTGVIRNRAFSVQYKGH